MRYIDRERISEVVKNFKSPDSVGKAYAIMANWNGKGWAVIGDLSYVIRLADRTAGPLHETEIFDAPLTCTLLQ